MLRFIGFAFVMTSGETTDAAVKSTASELVEDGRAKVNLTLRVVGRRVDGYHDLESVVAFADCADRLSLLPGPQLELKATGPLAEACGELDDNLVLKAARLLAEHVAGLKTGTFTLYKTLPVAAGIGGGRGGMSDAGGVNCGGGDWTTGAAASRIRRRSPERGG